MKTITKLVMATILCWAPSVFGLSLQEAMSGRYISLSAKANSSYTETALTLTNLTSSSVVVDFSTCFLVQSNSSQRVGLSYELGTGGYNLRFPANWNGTLRFSSRCLDQNRPAPNTGEYYASVGTISSQFYSITAALRAKYSQSSVWAITDSGSLASAWKAADSRGPYGGGGGGGTSSATIDLSGSCGWSTSGSSINIRAGRIDNLSRTTTSGSLRLRVWATRARYTGGSISGYVLGTRSLSQLRPGYYYSNVSGSVSYTRPPSGRFYTTITVEEYTTSGWVIRDYANMSSVISF